jgi:ferredoxin
MTRILSKAKLLEAAQEWLNAGKQVAGPKMVRQQRALYGWLEQVDDLVLDGFICPANSIKSLFLPCHEKLFAFERKGRAVELVPTELAEQQRVVLASRPCDAASLPILDHVFNWDYQDTFYNRRRELTTVVTLACKEHDEFCFCTSVGLAPDATKGSDVLLLPVSEGTFEVRVVTDKGRELIEPWTEESSLVGQSTPGPPARFELEEVQNTLRAGVDDVAWQGAALACVGCGACAHSCPTCHCFDIVDEATRDHGCRVRNWDSCQTVMYSMHASGHNPRHDQSKRQRNRIFHKYQTYPDKFGELLCTGCGACSRNCPMGLGVRHVLNHVLAAPQPSGSANA